MVKNLPANAGNPGSISEWGKSTGGGNGNPLQYSCLENPTDRGAWQAIVHRVTKSQTRLSTNTFTFPSSHLYLNILFLLSDFSVIVTFLTKWGISLYDVESHSSVFHCISALRVFM